jgi:hypothetical protein
MPLAGVFRSLFCTIDPAPAPRQLAPVAAHAARVRQDGHGRAALTPHALSARTSPPAPRRRPGRPSCSLATGSARQRPACGFSVARQGVPAAPLRSRSASPHTVAPAVPPASSARSLAFSVNACRASKSSAQTRCTGQQRHSNCCVPDARSGVPSRRRFGAFEPSAAIPGRRAGEYVPAPPSGAVRARNRLACSDRTRGPDAAARLHR